MSNQLFGIKDLYEVVFKATAPTKLGSRVFETGEPVLYFDNIQISLLSQGTNLIVAQGGKGNLPLIVWEDAGLPQILVQTGVFSEIGLALLMSANVLDHEEGNVHIPMAEVFEVLPNCEVMLSREIDQSQPHFFYEYANRLHQRRIMPVSIDGRRVTLPHDVVGKMVLADYYFKNDTPITIFVVSKDRLNHTYKMEAKYNEKNEGDGANHTSILVMPKVKVSSNIYIRAGEMASPSVSEFRLTAMPVRTTFSDSSVIEMFRLGEDLS